MLKFSKEKVLLFHKLLTEETGGDPNIRDITLLDSALKARFKPLEDRSCIQPRKKKGARLGYSLISNHAFVYGNRRIGMYVLLTFLGINGVRIHPTVDDVARVGLAVAVGDMQYEELLQWIIDNK